MTNYFRKLCPALFPGSSKRMSSGGDFTPGGKKPRGPLVEFNSDESLNSSSASTVSTFERTPSPPMKNPRRRVAAIAAVSEQQKQQSTSVKGVFHFVRHGVPYRTLVNM